MFLVTLCWVSCDELVSRPGGGSSNGPGDIMLGVHCDGLALHPGEGRGGGEGDATSRFMLKKKTGFKRRPHEPYGSFNRVDLTFPHLKYPTSVLKGI